MLHEINAVKFDPPILLVAGPQLDMPTLVDGIDEPVGAQYTRKPDGLEFIVRKGTAACTSGSGPFEFKPGKLEQSLSQLLDDG